MTVDVEDYFQVSAFAAAVARSSWDNRESRVCRNTERLLELFDAAKVQGDVLRARLGGGAVPAARAAHRRTVGTSWHRTATSIGSCTRRPDGNFARICIARGCVLEHAGGCSVVGYRAPSYSDHAPVAVGARRADRGRLRLRLEHLSDPTRSVRYSRLVARGPSHRSCRQARSGSCLARRSGGLGQISRLAGADTSGCCRTAGPATAFGR